MGQAAGALMAAVLFFIGPSVVLQAQVSEDREARAATKTIEELDEQEKKRMIPAILAEGDRYFGEKNYNRANAAYERVFLLEPENVQASERIDRLKRQMLREGKAETELVGGVYDAEIEARTHAYWEQARQLLKEEKTGQARLVLEKLLLINPLHGKARSLYERLQSDLESATE